MEIYNFKKGQALYLGIIILVIILGVGLGISNIIVGQFKMMGVMEKSVIALQAADTGTERILYEDKLCRQTTTGGCSPNCSEDFDNDTYCDGIIDTFSLSSQPVGNGAEYAVKVSEPFLFRSIGTFQKVSRAVEVFIPNYKRVFVTSSQFTGDLITECNNVCVDGVTCLTKCGIPGISTDGVKAADQICNILAQNVAATPLPGTYKAWITGSSIDSSPLSRFSSTTRNSSVPFRRIDEKLVANKFSDLIINGAIVYPIEKDESGNQVSDRYVWTNTNSDGERASAFNHCNNWNSSSSSDIGLLGYNSATNQYWTNAGTSPPCSEKSFSLYCFQQ